MPPLQLRQEFPTLKAFKEALHTWAIEEHFEPRILKSDTGRVRVGCKRDPNCPFVVRCNWERKNGREPLARVTVLRDRHTCINGLEWRPGSLGNGVNGMGGGGGMGMMGGVGGLGSLEIREDDQGNIVGGARVLGMGSVGRGAIPSNDGNGMVPVLPKVQRNSASRLPFLMEILPRLMEITKETTPVEIRETLLREYGAEVHLQQCRRAKTEILKKTSGGGDGGMNGNGSLDGSGMDNTPQQLPSNSQDLRAQQNQQQQNSMVDPSMGPGNDANEAANNIAAVTHQQLFGDINAHSHATPNQSPHPFQLHATQAVVTPSMPNRSTAALNAVGEPPVRCPYCVNHRWMKSIKDAVEHMSMHVVV